MNVQTVSLWNLSRAVNRGIASASLSGRTTPVHEEENPGDVSTDHAESPDRIRFGYGARGHVLASVQGRSAAEAAAMFAATRSTRGR